MPARRQVDAHFLYAASRLLKPNARFFFAIFAASVLAVIANGGTARADITTEKWAKPWPVTQVSVPAYYNASVHRIAVMPFTVNGDDKALSESLMNQLLAAIAQEGYIEVVSRTEMEHVLSEQRFQTSGFADPATAKEVGMLLGVDAIVVGSASSISSDSERYQEQVVDYYRQIQKEKKVWNKEKGAYETKYYTERVPVYKQVWVVEQWSHASLEVKLVDIETGGVLYAGTGSGDYSNRNFDNEGTTYLDSAMEAWVISDAIEELKRLLTPWRETITTVIICYAGDFINPTYQEGWELAQRGKFEQALVKFNEAYRPDELKDAREQVIIWNEMIVLAAMGRLEEMEERIGFLEETYAQYIDEGQKRHIRLLRNFAERNFDRKYGSITPVCSLQIVAIDDDDIYVAPNKALALSPGQILVVMKAKNIINELTGEVLAVKETAVARLEVVEITDDYVLCRLVNGAVQTGEGVVQVGDRAKPE